MNSAKVKKPPSHLSKEARAWFRRTAEEFCFQTSAEWQLLEEAAGCIDRITQCRERIATDGLTVKTAHGCKPHPCLAVERDNRILFSRLCRELRLGEPSDDESNRVPRMRG